MLGFWFIHLFSLIDHQNIKRQSFIFFIRFYMVIQRWVTKGFKCFGSGFIKKIVWISLTNIFIISDLIIAIFDSLKSILHPSLILFIYFYFITFLINVLLWRGKHQNTGCVINIKRNKRQAPKDLSSVGVVDHIEGGKSAFVICRFWYHLGKTWL